MIELATGRERALTTEGGGLVSFGMAEFVAQEEMDRREGYWWSPDSRSLAFEEADDTDVPPTGFTRKDSSNEPAAVVGCACAIDGSNNIHIVWSARSSLSLTRYLRYAVFDTGTDTWGSVTTILSNLDYDDIGQGDENTAIALDADGKAHVVFLSTVGGTHTFRRLYYATNATGSWVATTQADSDVTYDYASPNWHRAWHPSVEFDEHGRMVVIWIRGGWNSDNDTGTVYVRTKETDGTWNSSVSAISDSAV